MKLINLIGPLKRLLYRLNQFDLNFKHFSSKIGRYYRFRQQYPLFWFETHQYIKFSKVSETSFFSFFQSKTELLKNPERKACMLQIEYNEFQCINGLNFAQKACCSGFFRSSVFERRKKMRFRKLSKIVFILPISNGLQIGIFE